MLSESHSTVFFLFIIALLLTGGLSSQIFFKHRAKEAAIFSTAATALALIGCGVVWLFALPSQPRHDTIGYLATELSWVLASLILFTSLIIHSFSLRYMAGDRLFSRYFLYLNLVTSAILSSAAADHLVLLLLSLGLAYFILMKLMVHKPEWSAAKQAGLVAAKTFGLGLLLLAIGGFILFLQFKTLSISQLLKAGRDGFTVERIVAVLCLIMGAFTFSGVWPFQRFLVSSTNSPTPVFSFDACWPCEWRRSHLVSVCPSLC